jgi:translation initiation factor RLI1
MQNLQILQTAFIVEHDFIMAAYLADRVVVYDGVPSSEATAHCPQSLLTGDQIGSHLCTPHLHMSGVHLLCRAVVL